MEKNYPILYDRMRGVASAFGRPLERVDGLAAGPNGGVALVVGQQHFAQLTEVPDVVAGVA